MMLAMWRHAAIVSAFWSMCVASNGLADSLGLASEVEPDANQALKRGLELARQANAWLLITGSLYLVGAWRPAVIKAAIKPAIDRDDRPS